MAMEDRKSCRERDREITSRARTHHGSISGSQRQPQSTEAARKSIAQKREEVRSQFEERKRNYSVTTAAGVQKMVKVYLASNAACAWGKMAGGTVKGRDPNSAVETCVQQMDPARYRAQFAWVIAMTSANYRDPPGGRLRAWG